MTMITIGNKPVAILATVVEKLEQTNDQTANATNMARKPFIGGSKNLDDSSLSAFMVLFLVKSLIENPHVIAPHNCAEDYQDK
jgi:hypothetical protein